MLADDWPWGAADGKRLARALGVSLLLHAAILTWVKIPPPERRNDGRGVLTVAFRAHAQAPSPAPVEIVARPDVTAMPESPMILTQEQSIVAVAKPPKAATFVPVPAVGAMAAPPSQPLIFPRPMPGQQKPVGPRGANVMLLIDDDGKVAQIFWGELPGLTHEQFRRIELAIRAKTYPGSTGQRIYETIDLQPYLAKSESSSSSSPVAGPTDN